MAYTSCWCVGSQPSTAAQNVASRRASGLSRVSIFKVATAIAGCPLDEWCRCPQSAYVDPMADRTKATAPSLPAVTASTAGVLRPDELARHVDLVRSPAGAAAARWVENHWS